MIRDKFGDRRPENAAGRGRFPRRPVRRAAPQLTEIKVMAGNRPDIDDGGEP